MTGCVDVRSFGSWARLGGYRVEAAAHTASLQEIENNESAGTSSKSGFPVETEAIVTERLPFEGFRMSRDRLPRGSLPK